MAKAKSFLRLHLKGNYSCLMRQHLQCMRCYLPKMKYLVQYNFWNVDHNNGRKQNIVQKKAVKASKACRKKSSAFKRKTSPYQVRRDLLYYHRWTHLQKYFVITKIILLLLWITLYSPVEPSTAQYIPVQSGTFQYCPVQPSTAQEVNWFSDTVDYSWNMEQL